MDEREECVNATGKGSYLWHLRRAAILDREADRLERAHLPFAAHEAREQAEEHRADAMILDLERRAAA